LPEASTCRTCGAELPHRAPACPHCRHLVHAAELEGFSTPAQAGETAGARQAAAAWAKRLGPIGVAVAFAVGKGKFLLLGLSKLKTLVSMLAFLGVYWALHGWQWAAGFVAGIYIHEMGHVWALHRFGLRAGAPMFIPGFGAFVSLYGSPANAGQDARIGLAGPLWGAAAALGFWLPGMAMDSGVLLAIAHTTAWLNLFNLTPVWQLDGGRGFRALDRTQRISMLVLLLLLWAATREGMLWIPILGAVYRALISKDAPPGGDRTVLSQFAGLVVFLAMLLASVPGPRQ
jgi:Zn-dependent protease